jgi:hypothetical protein
MSRPIEEIKADIEEYKHRFVNSKLSDNGISPSSFCDAIQIFEKELKEALIESIPLDRLEEICNAERDGRCVVLPCKVGDKVQAAVNRPFNGHNLTIHGEVIEIQPVVRVRHSEIRYVDFIATDFEKTVFLTQELSEQTKEHENK